MRRSLGVKENNENRNESDSRRVMGRAGRDAAFPVPPSHAGLPSGYAEVLASLKQRISSERIRAVLSANSAMVLLYWDIGRTILQRQETEGWGAKVIDRLATDLRLSFPEMKGLSSRNLKYMRTFAEVWPDRAFVQQVVAQLPWGHNVRLIDRLDNSAQRTWYLRKAIENGWSRNILAIQIEQRLHERQGNLVSNFATTMPPAESDMAVQIFKDPYLFDFLGTADARREREVEGALVNHIQSFLLELGSGFAFVGRQVPLEVGDQDFLVDLLFYHLRLRCYVVVELKSVPFDPSFVGQLNVYLSAVDDLLRHPDDKPTIGLLLCKTKNHVVVEYALRDLQKPIGVAEWKTQLGGALPDDLRSSLPTIEELERELAGEFGGNEEG